MRITLRQLAINVPEFLLADDDSGRIQQGVAFPYGAGGEIRYGFHPRQTRSVQEAQLPRSQFAFLAARFNVTKQFSFVVQRAFQTRLALLNFTLSHDDLVPAQGMLIIYDVSAGEHAYLPGVIPVEIACISTTRFTCDYQYTFKANAPWQNHP